jgi:hypothetical protein
MYLDEKKAGEPARPTDAIGELLWRAADLMESKPHLAKGALVDAMGNVCLRGAVLCAAHGHYWHLRDWWHDSLLREADNRVAKYLKLPGRLGMRSHPNTADWNNSPERTKEEVVAALRAAALTLCDA